MVAVGDWIIENCSTVGTGNLILTGTSPGFARFSAVIPAGLVYYSIFDGANKESGIGTFNGTDTITRTTVQATLVNGVYSGSNPPPIGLSGSASVACTFTANALSTIENHLTDTSDPHNTSAAQVSYDPTSDPIITDLNVQDALFKLSNSVQERVASLNGIISGGFIANDLVNFHVSAGTGKIYDSYTDPEETTVTNVSWFSQNNIPLNFGGNTFGNTKIFMDATGTVLQVPGAVNPTHFRDYIFLGVVYFVDNSIVGVLNAPSVIKQTSTTLYDFVFSQQQIDGCSIEPVTGQLQVWCDEGSIIFPGSNWYNNVKNPNIVSIPAVGDNATPIAFRPSTRNGLLLPSATSIPLSYNPSANTITALGAGEATIHRLYMIGVNGSRQFILVQGQNIYPTVNDARANLSLDQDSFVSPSNISDSFFIGYICVSDTSVDFSDPSAAWITSAGSSQGGGSSPSFDHTTLSQREAPNQHPIDSIGSGPEQLRDLLNALNAITSDSVLRTPIGSQTITGAAGQNALTINGVSVADTSSIFDVQSDGVSAFKVFGNGSSKVIVDTFVSPSIRIGASNVSHGMSAADDDVFFTLRGRSLDGGTQLSSYGGGGLNLFSATSSSPSSLGAVSITVAKKNGTGTQFLSPGDLAFSIHSNGSIFSLYAQGDLELPGNVTANGVLLAGGTLSNIVEDTTPQLGGNLDVNGFGITGLANLSVTGTVTANGVVLAGGTMSNLVEDTTPQLGGNLDTNGFDITGLTNLSVTGTVTANGTVLTGNLGTMINLIDDTTPQLGGNLDTNGFSINNLANLSVSGSVTAGGTTLTGNLGTMTDVVNDTTPSLGGNLDTNGFSITGLTNLSVSGTVTAGGTVLTGNLGTMTDVVNDTTPQLGGNLDVNGFGINGLASLSVAGSVTAGGVTLTGNTGTLNNIVEDTTPQLGGNLDVNGFGILNLASLSVSGSITSGGVTLTGNTGTLNNIVEDTTPQLGGNLDANGFLINGLASLAVSGSVTAGGVTLTGNTGTLNNIVEDVTPQLGGNLDTNGFGITGLSSLAVSGSVTAGGVTLTGNTGTLSNLVEDTTPSLGGNLDTNGFDITGLTNLAISGGLATGGAAQHSGALSGKELSADPTDPAEGEYVLWMSDGTGSGNDGDILIKRTVNSVTNTLGLGIDPEGLRLPGGLALNNADIAAYNAASSFDVASGGMLLKLGLSSPVTQTILGIVSDNITHPFTDFQPTNSNFRLTTRRNGDVFITNFSDSSIGFWIEGNVSSASTTAGVIQLRSYKSDGGTSRAALDATEVALSVVANPANAAGFLVYGDYSLKTAGGVAVNNAQQVTGAYSGKELSVDPADPAEGEYVLWMSDGTGTGDDGDILVKSTAGGLTETTNLSVPASGGVVATTGTFVPTLGGGFTSASYSLQHGYYHKLGRLVNAYAIISTNATTFSSSAGFSIQNFPFPTSQTGLTTGTSVLFPATINIRGMAKQAGSLYQAKMGPNQNRVSVGTVDDNGSSTFDFVSAASQVFIEVSVCYLTDS